MATVKTGLSTPAKPQHRKLGIQGFALTGALIMLGGFTAPYEVTWYNMVDISLF